MKCCSCGKEIPDQAKFCSKCGAKQAAPLKPAEPKKKENPSKEVKKKKGSKIPLLIFLCLLLCAGAGIGGYFVFQAVFQDKVELDDVETEKDSLGAWGRLEEETDVEEEEPETKEDKVEPEEETKEEETLQEETVQEEIAQEEIAQEEIAMEPSGESVLGESLGENSTDSDFVLPDSSTRYLSEADLYGLTADQLRIARNEMYARHGRMFNDEALQAYFNSKPWYYGTIAPNNFDEMAAFNDYEKQNLILIKEREALLGN